MIDLKEVFSYNKAAYIIGCLVATMLAEDVETPLWIVAATILATILTSFIFGILTHLIGRNLGIASLRFLTFSSRTPNGKILSVICNTLLWVAVLTKAFIVAQDKYWLQISESGVITNSQISVVINGLGVAILALAAIETIFVLYMIANKVRLTLTFFNKKKVNPQT